jgi:hypothetical protein
MGTGEDLFYKCCAPSEEKCPFTTIFLDTPFSQKIVVEYYHS